MIRIILLGLFVLSTHLLCAQTFGIKAGLNYSNVVQDDRDLEYGEFIYGLHGGVFFYKELTDKIFVKGELLYSQKGYNLNIAELSPGPRVADNLKRRFNYFSFPLLVEYQILNHIGVNIGPEFSYLISAKESPDNLDDSNLLDAFNRFDIGISSGLSFSVLENCNVDIRYIHGLSALNKTTTFSDLQNRLFQLSIGYKLL